MRGKEPNMADTGTTITLSVTLSEGAAQLLAEQGCGYDSFVPFAAPDGELPRFEPVDDGDPDAEEWRGGTLSWCASTADAILFQAAERAAGHRAMILWDTFTAAEYGHGPVVLSTRPFGD